MLIETEDQAEPSCQGLGIFSWQESLSVVLCGLWSVLVEGFFVLILCDNMTDTVFEDSLAQEMKEWRVHFGWALKTSWKERDDLWLSKDGYTVSVFVDDESEVLEVRISTMLILLPGSPWSWVFAPCPTPCWTVSWFFLKNIFIFESYFTKTDTIYVFSGL